MSAHMLKEELAELPKAVSGVPHTELVACHPSMVQIKVRLVTSLKPCVLYSKRERTLNYYFVKFDPIDHVTSPYLFIFFCPLLV